MGRKGFNNSDKMQAKAAFLAGDSFADVAARVGCCERTAATWVKRYGWDVMLQKRRQSPRWIEDQINRLSQGNMTESKIRRVNMLSRTLERLQKLEPKVKPRPKVMQVHEADLLKQALHDDFGLYPYQKAFLQDTSRFRHVLKSRQIGFSWVLALDALLSCATGRNQLIISASQEQSDILIDYAIQHAAKLGIVLDAQSRSELSFGTATIRAMPANQRTIQGFNGDVILDEFAWQQNPKRIWRAVIPSITAIGGRIAVCSAPFIPGNLFWEIATNAKGRWNQYQRHVITIHDAIAQGMVLPGGLDELRDQFDAESWAMMFECQWAEDGHALLAWELIDKATTDLRIDKRLKRDLAVWVGVDVGRSNDRTCIAVVASDGDKWQLLRLDSLKNQTFAAQKAEILRICGLYQVQRLQIDRTGIGMQISEELCAHYPGKGWGVHFTNPSKQRMALNLLHLFERQQLRIPRDTDIMRQLHAVKKMSTPSGNAIKYDAARDETGHADAFWAVALACDGLASGNAGGVVIEIW